MSLKDKIDALTNKIKDLREQATKLDDAENKLRIEREILLAKSITEDSVLLDTNWELEVITTGGAKLLFKASVIPDVMKALLKLSKDDFHSRFELSDGIMLRFDDDEISISFKENRQLMPFIKKYGLKVSGNKIADKLAKLKRDVAALEVVCHTFNI